MHTGGNLSAHKDIRTGSSTICATDFSPGPNKSEYTVTNRQQICSGIYQPYGRNSFENPEIWERAIQRNIHLTAVHIPGIENVKADFLSRRFLDQKLFTSYLQVDLFASRLNYQLPRYVS